MQTRLTIDYLKTGVVNFSPKTASEAKELQEALLGLGLVWLTGETQVQRIDRCIQLGLHIDRGRLCTGNDRRFDYVDATLNDLLHAEMVQIKNALTKKADGGGSFRRVPQAPPRQPRPENESVKKASGRPRALAARVAFLEAQVEMLTARLDSVLGPSPLAPATVTPKGVIKKIKP